ncbi:hypothetical protein JOC33_002189 [Thalassobacillus pellis]|nr:hypothetical protein [Thalassobacillus pellis]
MENSENPLLKLDNTETENIGVFFEEPRTLLSKRGESHCVGSPFLTEIRSSSSFLIRLIVGVFNKSFP